MTSLKDIRTKKGVKQVAVADYLGVNRHTYANYEANPQKMRVEQARAVCDFLGCNIEEVFLIKNVN